MRLRISSRFCQMFWSALSPLGLSYTNQLSSAPTPRDSRCVCRRNSLELPEGTGRTCVSFPASCIPFPLNVSDSCRRLGLTPLCYLWNRDQGELLNEMINSGMEAVLIKVAGIGLTTKHLGKTLAEMQPTLVKLVSNFIITLPRQVQIPTTRIAFTERTSVAKVANTKA